MDSPNVDWLSVYLTFFFVLIVYAFYVAKKLQPLTASVLALMALLGVYKVGHNQYFSILNIMIILWICTNLKKSNWKKALMIYSPLAYVDSMSVLYLPILYYSNKWLWVRDIAGLPMFVLMIISISTILVHVCKNKKVCV